MAGEIEAGSQRVPLREITLSLRLWSMLPMLETDSSYSRPHGSYSSYLLRQLPLTGGGEHREAEGEGDKELRVGREDMKGEDSSRKH